ncbi:MAG TPA: hypothetical protein VM537_12095 [Anaerolineae bacterium]|nr:hypothetical protein [Anaerolineae bacterium]
MGNKKSTQTSTTSIAPAGGQEQQMMALLSKLGIESADQLSNLGNLANGQGLVPNSQDRALVEQSIGASSDMARRQLQGFVEQQQLGLDDSLSARGVQGSSIESMNRAVIGRDANRQFANMASQEQQQGAQALMQLPFQRANVQLNANQALFQRLSGASNQVLSQSLQDRLANQTQTSTQEESGMSFNEMGQIGARIGAAALTGGTSEIAFQGAGALNSMQQGKQMFPPQQGSGNTYGLNFNRPGGSSPYYGRR